MSRFSFLNMLPKIGWTINNYMSFDIFFLDMRNKTDNSIPIAMTYRYISFLDLIEFMVKHKHGDIIDFSWEYRDSGIIFRAKENGDSKDHWIEVKAPDVFIGDESDLHKYILDCTKAMATLLWITYKPIDGNIGYSTSVSPYCSIEFAANVMAIDLDASSLEFPITIKTNEDKFSVFKKLGMTEKLAKSSYINIFRKNTFKNENELLTAMYRI